MRSVLEHRAAVLSVLRPRPFVEVATAAAAGSVLARDLRAATDLPGVTNSAMDGYAVRSQDLSGAGEDSPVTLEVVGDIAAGDTRHHDLPAGKAMRIMTGAPLPDGADAIVPVEFTDGGTERASFTLAPEVGRHLRHRGEDVRTGDVVVTAGTPLTAAHLALIAAANIPHVPVHPRPRVAIVSTGDELVPPGSPLRHGQVVDSNRLMLAALVEAAGAEVVASVHVADDVAAVTNVMAQPPGSPDLVITSGGVSMGAYDPVKEALAATGDVEFVSVAMRPGKPQGVGLVAGGRVPLVALPGNPVSSYVSFHVFVLPALRRLAGFVVPADPGADLVGDGAFAAVCAADWAGAPGKTEFSRVRTTPEGIVPSGGQGSHMLAALAAADALAILPPSDIGVRAGDRVTALPLLGTRLAPTFIETQIMTCEGGGA